MLKKLISALLVWAVALLTVTPPSVSAQTLKRSLAQSGTELIEPNPKPPAPKPKPELRKSFAAEMAGIKAGTLSDADLQRLEKEQQDQQSSKPSGAKWTRRNTIFMTLFVVVLTGVVWVAIKHRCRDSAAKPCPEIDNSSNTDY